MARKSKERIKAMDEYLRKNGKISTKELAEKYGKSPGTMRNWKWKDNWDQKLAELSSVAESDINGKKKKSDGRRGSYGNKGGGAPKGNKNALKHGAYANVTFQELPERYQKMYGAFLESYNNEDAIKANVALLSTMIIGAAGRTETFAHDMFGNKYKKEVSEEAREKSITLLHGELHKDMRLLADIEARKERHSLEEKKLEFKNKLEGAKGNHLDDDEDQQTYGVVMLPPQTIGKDNEIIEEEGADDE